MKGESRGERFEVGGGVSQALVVSKGGRAM